MLIGFSESVIHTTQDTWHQPHGTKARQGRCHPNMVQADVCSGLLVFIFAVEPWERVHKFVNHHADERGFAGQSCVHGASRHECNTANRHKALVAARHPYADIETRKLLLVYTSFLLFSSLKPSFTQTMDAVWPSSASGPDWRDGRSAGAFWFALEWMFTSVGGSIVLA